MELFHPKYVFDTGPFIDLKNYPHDVFATLWTNFDQLIRNGHIISSTEVLRELHAYDDGMAEWANANRRIFVRPSVDEQAEVRAILRKHPELIRQEAILLGKPQADPFVIALAKIHSCPLVHNEKFKPNAHRIPNVCKDFGVAEISLFEFFKREGWKF
jgi:hypothetical protein